MSRSQLDFARAHEAARGRRGVVESMRSPGSGARFRFSPSALGKGAALDAEPEGASFGDEASAGDPLSALASLAAGVAHEIDEPLTYVVANIELVMQAMSLLSREHRGGCSLVDGDALAQRIDSLMGALRSAADGVGRMHQIVRDVRSFSTASSERRALLDVRSVVDPVVRMAWGEVSRRARYERVFADVPLVRANEARLSQVFLHLLINAAEAIAPGQPDDNVIRVLTRTDEDGRVVIEVSDTGRGIAKEHAPRIFDPFFTTKPAGFGAGLGLTICQRAVRDLGGEIVVAESSKRGSVFRVMLPAALLDPTDRGRPARCPSAPLRARVLVIDDEPLITEALRMALSDRHDVVATTRASKALRMLAAGERFDVILCDLMMPGMTGMDLHAALLRALPAEAERIVFVTGGAFTVRAREFLDSVPNKWLEKPFDLDDLAAMLSDLAHAAREREGA